MRGAVLYATKQPLVVEEIEIEQPREGEVLVRMAAAGVCHSDLHVINGDVPAVLPAVLGHEGAGVVEAVGPRVTAVAPGDHVILLWRLPCMRCRYCVSGKPALCAAGAQIRWTGKLLDGTTRFHKGGQEIYHFGGVSTFGEYTVLPEGACVKIRKDVPLEAAALVGCGVMTGVGAVINTAKVEPGASVAVFGCGGVGLNVIQGARLVSAGRIIAVDVLPYKLELARQFGATDTINANEADPVEAIKALTGGDGADYAFEVIGLARTIRQAMDATRRGGAMVMVGLPPVTSEMSIRPSDFILNEKRILGSLYGSTIPWIDMPRLLDLYVAGRLDLDRLISRRYPITAINDAFAALERGEVARSVIVYS